MIKQFVKSFSLISVYLIVYVSALFLQGDLYQKLESLSPYPYFILQATKMEEMSLYKTQQIAYFGDQTKRS